MVLPATATATARVTASEDETDGGRVHVCLATEADAGTRLDKWLAGAAPDLSRARIQQLLATGRVSLDGAILGDAALRVKPGMRVIIAEPAPVDAVPRPQAMALTVVYEDADLIVLDKPAGLVVHPAPGNPDATLVNALLAHCGESLAGIGGERRPGIVHRLDKDTSGLMVAAKTETALQGLAVQFADHSIRRAYQAMVWGLPVPVAGTVDAPIGRHPVHRKKMAVVARGGKAARTQYRVIERLGPAITLVACRLATGRTHQVRVHMAHLGHPLVGDPVYGRKSCPRECPPPVVQAIQALGRQALHAVELGFRHPRTGEDMLFQSSLPADLQAILNVSIRNNSEKQS